MVGWYKEKKEEHFFSEDMLAPKKIWLACYEDETDRQACRGMYAYWLMKSSATGQLVVPIREKVMKEKEAVATRPWEPPDALETTVMWTAGRLMGFIIVLLRSKLDDLSMVLREIFKAYPATMLLSSLTAKQDKELLVIFNFFVFFLRTILDSLKQKVCDRFSVASRICLFGCPRL